MCYAAGLKEKNLHFHKNDLNFKVRSLRNGLLKKTSMLYELRAKENSPIYSL